MAGGSGNNDVDVVVIGAGIAGLEAARQLLANGLTVRVLEGRDRVGGRLLSVDAGAAPIDLGATYFWQSNRRVRRLVELLNIPTHPQPIDGDALQQSSNGITRLAGNPYDSPAMRFSPGAQALAIKAAERLPAGVLSLNEPVLAVRATKSHLSTDTENESIQSRHVVMALPPALAIETIQFSHELPENLMAATRATPVWMGGITKVVTRYPEAFWRQQGLSGAALSEVGPMDEIHDMSGPDSSPAALFGFVEPNTDEETVSEERVIDQLVELFGSEAADPSQIYIQDWRREPFTTPGTAATGTLQGEAQRVFSQPALDGRLHWASTETAEDNAGHIEGALSAGVRAALTIVRAYRLLVTQDGDRRL